MTKSTRSYLKCYNLELQAFLKERTKRVINKSGLDQFDINSQLDLNLGVQRAYVMRCFSDG